MSFLVIFSVGTCGRVNKGAEGRNDERMNRLAIGRDGEYGELKSFDEQVFGRAE